MTIRDLGEMAIKILGVYYAASAVVTLGNMLSAVVRPQTDGFSTADVVVTHLIAVAGMAVVAGICLLRGRILAGRLFSDGRVFVTSASRRDYLFVGISLIGVVWVVSGLPEIITMAGTAIWYAEASRLPMLEAMMRESTETVLAAALSIVVGVAVIMSAGRLATRLDAER